MQKAAEEKIPSIAIAVHRKQLALLPYNYSNKHIASNKYIQIDSIEISFYICRQLMYHYV